MVKFNYYMLIKRLNVYVGIIILKKILICFMFLVSTCGCIAAHSVPKVPKYDLGCGGCIYSEGTVKDLEKYTILDGDLACGDLACEICENCHSYVTIKCTDVNKTYFIYSFNNKVYAIEYVKGIC